jgi:hypothetical protein
MGALGDVSSGVDNDSKRREPSTGTSQTRSTMMTLYKDSKDPHFGVHPEWFLADTFGTSTHQLLGK